MLINILIGTALVPAAFAVVAMTGRIIGTVPIKIVRAIYIAPFFALLLFGPWISALSYLVTLIAGFGLFIAVMAKWFPKD